MSLPSPMPDGPSEAFLWPPYVWKTNKGRAATGGDAGLVSEKIAMFGFAQTSPSTRFGRPQLETSEALDHFSKLEIALRSLRYEPEADEFGLVRPSSSSVARVKEVLFPLVQRGISFPEALDVGTDHDGAIRVVWEDGPRFLELVAPYEDHAEAYFYYSEGAQFGLQRDLKTDTVRRIFDWLRGAH
jgi:hypothetical protein